MSGRSRRARLGSAPLPGADPLPEILIIEGHLKTGHSSLQ